MLFRSSASFPYIETGAVQIYDDRDLTVYPNPSSGLVELSGGAVDGKTFTATITDQQGRVVRILDNTYRFDLSSFGGGVYTLTVRGDHVLLNKRIIIAQ